MVQPLERALERVATAAWDAYSDGRKSPLTRKADPGYADPDYELAVDWLAAREAVHAAQRRHDHAAWGMQFLLINCSSRSEHTCPGDTPVNWSRGSSQSDPHSGKDARIAKEIELAGWDYPAA